MWGRRMHLPVQFVTGAQPGWGGGGGGAEGEGSATATSPHPVC